MKRRILAVMLSVLLLVSLFPSALAADYVEPFTDVPVGKFYAEAVAWAVENEITKGTSATTFSPGKVCSRGEVVTFLWRAAGSPEPNSTENPFTDVETGKFYYEAVLWAVESGITKGTTETTFSPNQECTRGEVVTFLWRAAGSPDPESLNNPFEDVKSGKFYYKAVLWAVENEITKGTSETTFAPNEKCSRGEIVTFLFRAAQMSDAEKVLEVAQDGSCDYDTIQEAVNAAKPGQTVLVHEGVYREEVVFPRSGTDEENRIVLRAAEGESVTVTASDPVPGEWKPVRGMDGVWVLDVDNNYFPGHKGPGREKEVGRLPGSTTDLEEYNPFNMFWRSRANSSSPSADGKLGYVSCGTVYLNGEPISQRWSLNGEAEGITNNTFGTVAETPNTWIAYVDKLENGNPDKNGGQTHIYANFGELNPNEEDTEINVRMQCITAVWNQGYITVDGINVMRGAGPKTVDFWQTRAEGMFGAISTNGGHHWIIENCDVTQCRGVGIDFGNGSRGQEDRYGAGYDYGNYSDNQEGGFNGNGPELYGYHIIRNCNIHDNATNGVFAYRGAYTEVYGCSFINNNCINTGLASEAYFKNVSGGFGINLHDNYFYSDQAWRTMPIWMDCENDRAIVANNVVYGNGPVAANGQVGGFSTISYELNAGWNLFANNIIINCTIGNGVNGNLNVVNNLLINTGNFNVIGSASQARAGAEGGSNNAATVFDELTTGRTTSARNRTNRIVYPGTLDEITTVNNPTSRFDGYSRYNKFMGNLVFGSTAPNTSGKNYNEEERVTGYGEFVLKRQDECEEGHVAMPDFSGGVAYFHAGLPDVVALQEAGTIFDWVWVYAAGNAGNKPIARTVYGNEANYDLIVGNLPERTYTRWEERGFEADGAVALPELNSYVIDGDKDHFNITLKLDETVNKVSVPLFTSEFMGPSDILLNVANITDCPPTVDKDILGNARSENNVVGPFADLKPGVTTYELWPQRSTVAHEDPVDTLVVAQDGSGDFTTIQAAADVVDPGQTILVHEGVYREEVILPQGGVNEENRITIKAAEGEKVVITGSEPAAGWVKTSTAGVYCLTLEKDFFGINAEGNYFNPFATNWMSKGGQYPGFFSCGCVWVGDTDLAQRWTDADVYSTANTWIASVDEESGKTLITANFGEINPNDPANQVEVNNRMQCLTAKWNQGYVTIDGITVKRGCGPKTIDFWMTTAEAMYGAIATNGGHHWIIENCEATQNRGVAIDFGNGSGKQEIKYGGEPELYGYHIIRNCDVHHNGTNGMMAYRGPYTEIYNCRLVNNNTLNTGLLSEAYIKDVSGGWGIKIHDNYFFTDLVGACRPIWLDCECDFSEITNNVICDANNGFTYVDLECNAGYILVANNVLVSTGFGTVLQSHAYLVNNLFLMNGQRSNTGWNSASSTAMPGAEGYDGYSRAMRIAEPGTLNMIGKEPTSRFETYNRFNKLFNNVFFDYGTTAASTRTTLAEDFNGVYTQVYLNPDPAANKDYSGGCWKDPVMNALYKGILAWIPVEGDESLRTGSMVFGNEIDYNVYYKGAAKINKQYTTDYVADEHSLQVSTGDYSFTATPDSFELTLEVDDSVRSIQAPAITGELLGKATCYLQEGYDVQPEDVGTDFFGNERDPENTVVGPFADLQAGITTYTLWPANEAGLKEYRDPMTFDAAVFKGSNDKEIPYRLRVGGEGAQPLLIWQHGSGAVGTDNEKQLNANDKAAYILAQSDLDAYVLAPQYPYKFSTPYLEGEKADMDAWVLAFSELVNQLVSEGKVDPQRIYLAGGSMGGGIVLELATQHPELFACVVAMCPRGTVNDDLTKLDVLKQTPMWLFHTEGDTTNVPEISDAIYNHMIEIGSTVAKYTRYTLADMEAAGIPQGYNHNASWRLGLADPELFSWMFSIRKN